MRWSAAGRAGGRAAAGSTRTGPRALLRRRLRVAVVPLLAAVAAVVGGVGAPPVQAAPLTSVPATATAPAPSPADDDVIDPDRPVQIEVGRFEPRTVTPGATVTVTGTMTNTGASTITDLRIRLQRGDVLTTRADLTAHGRDPDPATSVLPSFQTVPGELAPGDELPFSYTIPSDALHLERNGVYPVLLNVNGTVGGEQQRRVGELSSFVVQQPVVPAARTAVAWMWPLVERTHRDAAGRFVDDDLATAVNAGGRLDRALAVVEQLPDIPAPAGTEPAAGLRVTLAIDPALIEELEIMAAGYEVDGEPGRGSEAAAAFLERLRAVAADHEVMALPYGDVDVDALMAAGLPDVVTRSLPGTSEGTAQDPPGTATPDGTPATTSPAGSTPTEDPAAGEDEEDGTGAGAEILAEALDVEPRTELAWAGGSLRAGSVPTLRAGGVERVVIGTAGITDGDAATGLAGPAAAARSTVPTGAGPLDVLLADDALTEVVGSAEAAVGGPRMAEQRYLAELAVLTLQAPAGTEQTVLVAPPREVQAGPEGAGAMMAVTAELPWLRPATLDGLATGPAVAAGALVEPVDAPLLDPAGLTDVVDGVADRDDLAGAVVGDADEALAAQDAATARTVSVSWRSNPEGFRAVAADLRVAMAQLRERVTLLAPADGTYSLASSDAPLVLTVHNDLPFAVEVLLDVRTRGSRSLSIGDVGAVTLAPDERATLQVPTKVRHSGGFAVSAELTTPSGRPLGDRVEMQVKSTAYGPISLLITIGAAALLALLFLRRLIRFVLRRRRTAAAGPAQPEAGVPQPPTRSPV